MNNNLPNKFMNILMLETPYLYIIHLKFSIIRSLCKQFLMFCQQSIESSREFFQRIIGNNQSCRSFCLVFFSPLSFRQFLKSTEADERLKWYCSGFIHPERPRPLSPAMYVKLRR